MISDDDSFDGEVREHAFQRMGYWTMVHGVIDGRDDQTYALRFGPDDAGWMLDRGYVVDMGAARVLECVWNTLVMRGWVSDPKAVRFKR